MFSIAFLGWVADWLMEKAEINLITLNSEEKQYPSFFEPAAQLSFPINSVYILFIKFTQFSILFWFNKPNTVTSQPPAFTLTWSALDVVRALKGELRCFLALHSSLRQCKYVFCWSGVGLSHGLSWLRAIRAQREVEKRSKSTYIHIYVFKFVMNIFTV